ncbi:MAG: alpha/beta fold hydrolase [Albidovulum sp.]
MTATMPATLSCRAGSPPEQDPDRIASPTLAMHCQGDLFGTRKAARRTTRAVPGAEPVGVPAGGHIRVGRDAEVFEAVAAFLRSAA